MAMYVMINPKSKKEIKERLAKGEKMTIFQPGPFNTGEVAPNSQHAVEGPHYPEPHKWYGTVTLDENSHIKTIK